MYSTKIKEFIRDNPNHQLPEYAWPGGAPIYYMDAENSILCPACATKDYDDPDRTITDYAINEEDSDLYCDECGMEIDTAYDDDDDDFGDSPEWLDLHMGDDE